MIEARVRLTLPKYRTEIVVSYNTYEPVTFDQYLAASIVAYSQSENDVYQFIDDITGKSSLNNHFKKLVEDIQKMDDNTVHKILDNSIYPTTRIENYDCIYYPNFDVSEYKGKIIKGDIRHSSSDDLKKLLNIQEDIISKEFETKEDTVQDTYSIRFETEYLKICVNKHDWLPLSSEYFNHLYKSDIKDFERYKGTVCKVADGKGWSVLTSKVLDRLCESERSFYDDEGNHVLIDSSLEVTQITKVHGLYLYRKNRIEYAKQNGNKCQRALEFLLSNEFLFDFPTEHLVKLTRCVKEHWQQKVVNYILSRRDDSKIAEIGCNLVSSFTEGWEKEALLSIKKIYSKGLTDIYKISSDLDYTDVELSRIDFKVLSIEHQERVKAHRARREEKINEVRGLIGEITSSGIRQRMRSIKATELTKIFTKELNRYVGHQKEDISKYTDSQLDDYILKIEEMYLHFLDVQKMLDEKPKI